MKKLLCLILVILFLFPITGCENASEKEPLDANDTPPALEEEFLLINVLSWHCDPSLFDSEGYRWISGWILYDDGDWMLLQVDPKEGYGSYVWVRHDGAKRDWQLELEEDGDFKIYGYATFSFGDLQRPIKPGYPVRVMDGVRLWY